MKTFQIVPNKIRSEYIIHLAQPIRNGDATDKNNSLSLLYIQIQCKQKLTHSPCLSFIRSTAKHKHTHKIRKIDQMHFIN